MKSSVIANVLAWMLACTAIGQAAETSNETLVSIKGMQCITCAKKVKKKLTSVPHVKSANVDPEKGQAVVIATDGKNVSPKSVWEAVESAGFEPTELKGPDGTFTSKPAK